MQRHHIDLGSPAAHADRGTPEEDCVHDGRGTGGQALALPTPSSLGWRLISQPKLDWAALWSSMGTAPIPQTRKAGGARELAVGGVLKRGLDIVMAALALVLLSPLFLTIGALVRLTMGGPVIFAHPRVGLNGRLFNCYKFRTMANDAEQILDRQLAQHPQMAKEWEETRKLAHDPRVTALGQILRKSSLDELPQFLNVLRGEMSCVGPRPVVAEELERYGPDALEYIKTRPGITGLWQISGRSRLSYSHRVALDSLYSRNWSIFLDLAILIRTLPAVLKFHETA